MLIALVGCLVAAAASLLVEHLAGWRQLPGLRQPEAWADHASDYRRVTVCSGLTAGSLALAAGLCWTMLAGGDVGAGLRPAGHLFAVVFTFIAAGVLSWAALAATWHSLTALPSLRVCVSTSRHELALWDVERRDMLIIDAEGEDHDRHGGHRARRPITHSPADRDVAGGGGGARLVRNRRAPRVAGR